ncbi:MAG: asparagine synthase (glutamine-hydrolyzing) [Methylotetracoccus sp.]
MCGISGLFSIHPEAPPGEGLRPRVDEMLRAMAHRGPDGCQSLAVSRGAIGAGRLAIRGLSNGMQPIVDEASGVVAVCNGEIDNHRCLRSWLATRGRNPAKDTDVAVIPGLYLELGDSFIDRLEGAFACAVYDPVRQRLVLARDRSGERPLFYWQHEGVIGFASELSALLAIESTPALAPQPIADYLRYGFMPAPHSPFAGVRKLRPGEMIVFDLAGGEPREEIYWRWPIVDTGKSKGSEDEFDRIFRNAVARQSEVDVPYGVFLSGGLDSSLVSAVLRSLRPDSSITAYTLRFREESYDEGDYANRIAELFGFAKRDIWVGPEELRAEIERLVALCGEPLADPAWAPAALCATAASADIKLALAGEGADELFGGYPTYLGIGLAERFRSLPRWLQRLIETTAERWPDSDKKVPVSFLIKRFLRGVHLDVLPRHQQWTSHTPPNVLAELMPREIWDRPPRGETGAPLDLVQRYDLENSLADGLLTKADRSGMSTGVEIRAPFLDPGVLDFAATLAADQRVRGFVTKAFLKRYALRYLPRDIVERRKRGLSVPLAKWLRGPLEDWARERVGSERLASAGISRAAALNLFDAHRQRSADHTRAIWSLAVLDIWLESLDAFAVRADTFERSLAPSMARPQAEAPRRGVPAAIA